MRHKIVIFLLALASSILFSADFSVEPQIFSPNESPGKKDIANINGYLEQTLPVNVSIYSAGTIKRTIPYTQFNYNCGTFINRATWDGKDNSGNFVPDGTYELRFSTFVNKLWSKGNSNRDQRGIFEKPYDVAIGSDGRIYVLDDERIQVFDSNKNYLFSIQPSPLQPGYLAGSSSIAVYGNRIYVMGSGYYGNNIKVFDTSGNYIKTFGSPGSGNGQFDLDWRNNIAVDSSGRIWVVDSGNSRVQVFDSEGNFLFKFGSEGTGNGQFDFTSVAGNVAIDSNNNAYITDSGSGIGRIQVFNSSGIYQRTIYSVYEGGPSQLVGINGPIAIVGTQNRICVSSFNNYKIVILNNDGTFYAQIGKIDQSGMVASKGRNPGEFDFISKLRGTSTNLYSAECYDNHRIQIFNTSGTFVSQIGMTQGEFLFPAGVAVGPDGKIYVCDKENTRIQIFNQSGVYQSQILIPYASDYTLLQPDFITVDVDGKIYICGKTGYGRLKVFDSSGNLLYDRMLKDGENNNIFVKGIAIIGNYIYVSGYYLSGQKRIFVFDKTGVFQGSFGSFEYNAYSDDDCGNIAAYQNRIYVIDKNGTKVYQTDGTLVNTLTQITQGNFLTIDSSGKIYVSGIHGIKVYDTTGNLLYNFGDVADGGSDLYFSPCGIAVDSQSNVYFSDDYYHRLYKYSTTSDTTVDTALCKVDNTKPVSIITYPPHTPINITDSFQLTGTGLDDNFAWYKVYKNSNLIFTGTIPVSNSVLADVSIFSYDAQGTYTLSLVVSDLADNTNSDSVVFYIDRNAPTSYVISLSQYTTSNSFQVQWTGSDSGTGIACYDIQYRDGENGIWTDWLTGTSQTSAIFYGQDGHTYYFRSRAKDYAGNQESYPSGYDTFTIVDSTKPEVIRAIPSDNSYVGANPVIQIEVYDKTPGSGIKSSSISVKIDGQSHSFIFSNNTITISPTFTRGLHTVEVNFSDYAGNNADTLTLHYNALNFQGSVVSLSPNPNPAVSEVMIGGNVYRWYKVVDTGNNPASGVTLRIQWSSGSITTDGSDANGIVACVLNSSALGSVNQTVTCYVVEAGGNTINPPISFQVKILPRASSSEFRFGSGINLKAAIGIGGKVGTEKGLTYRIFNTNLQSQSDDEIEIERSFEIEAGVVAEASVGGGVKNACYAGADAGIYASLVLMHTNTFLFDNPYDSDEQQILRSGLVIASLLEEMNTPIVSDMLGFVISQANALYPAYQTQETISAGIRAGAGASAGAGFGFGNKENVFLGLGVGAGISVEAEILGSLLFGFEYENNQLNPTEIGAGISTGMELDIFAGVQGNVIGDKIKAGIGADLIGKNSLTVFANPDGSVNRVELKISSKADWGLEYPGSGPGSTKIFTLILTGQQFNAIVNDLVDMLSLQKILQGQNPSSTVVLGPTEIASRFNTLVTKLTDYIAQTQLPLAYSIEEETGDSFGFSPVIKVAVGAEIEAGVSFDFEKAVTFTLEEGIFNFSTSGIRVYPLTEYQKDSYIPSCEDLNFTSIFDDCVSGIITAMTNLEELVIEVVEEIGDTIVSGIHWVSSKVDEYIPFWKKSYPRAKQLSSGLDEVFSFTPEGVSISHLSSQTQSQIVINNGSSSLVINPGESKAILTIHYSDSGITQQDESKLIMYQWDSINRRWVGLETSQVDTNLNNVYAEIEKLGMFRLGIPVPYGEIVLSLAPMDIDLSSPSTISVISQPILLVTGEIVPDGTLITVFTRDKLTSEIKEFGTITTMDADPLTPGVQIATIDGRISFNIMPPSYQGSGIIIANSVFGTASGKSYFNVVSNLDVDGNGLPDYWENMYFGSTGQNANGNPDSDGLTNFQEYKNRTDPKRFDTDNDGMSDGWEVNNQLNPVFDDSGFDPDNDGYSNLIEYQSGTDPHNKNSIPGNKGDLNNDGTIDISDVILCLRQAIGLDQQTLSSADMNEDGNIDISDVILVLRKAIGLD